MSRWPFAAAAFLGAMTSAPVAQHERPVAPESSWILEAGARDRRTAQAALERMAGSWHPGHAAMLVDMARLLPPPGASPGTDISDILPILTPPDGVAAVPIYPGASFRAVGERGDAPGADARRRIVRLLERMTSQRFGHDLDRWRRWIWAQPYDPHPDYAAFKRALYGSLDPRMRAFLSPAARATIRLDEIEWQGLGVNALPPLEAPAHAPAEAAGLKDTEIVFGVSLDGAARAYPRRIVARHEIVRDTLGERELILVSSALAGFVVPYAIEESGPRRFGASGLLYRAAPLLFDEHSGSLWSSLHGRPVLGSLVEAGVALRPLPVETAAWRDWRRVHPRTTALVPASRYTADPWAGPAYRQYLSRDRAIPPVPSTDSRLKNKAEVLGVRLPHSDRASGGSATLAIALDRLRGRAFDQVDAGGRGILVLTGPGGIRRIYDAGQVVFARRLAGDGLEDSAGRRWTVRDDALDCDEDPALGLSRLPAHRVFWFAWVAAFPETLLVE